MNGYGRGITAASLRLKGGDFGDEAISTALSELCNCELHQLSTVRIGKALGRIRGRVVGGYAIEQLRANAEKTGLWGRVKV